MEGLGWEELAPAGGRRRGQSFVPVGAAQPGSVGSFGRNRRFRHFNKLTVRDFAGAKRNGRAATDARIPFARRHCLECAGTEMLIRLLMRDLKEDHHGESSMETTGFTDRPQGPAQGKPRVQAAGARTMDTCGREQAEAARKGNTPTGVMSIKLQRPVAAIRSKAQREGISLKPVNRSPYNRRSKAAKRR
ncbi:hypothetical protein [Bradyrhizobium lupini]|uniref:hypothetical protein n=1 Tax=Rhizobium lupini TaxID=136996 RepID=UPI0034C63D0E